jgi:hypothetical protein
MSDLGPDPDLPHSVGRSSVFIQARTSSLKSGYVALHLRVRPETGDNLVTPFSNPCSVIAAGTEDGPAGFVLGGAISMLMFKEWQPAIQTLRGWAISVLQEAGAIRESANARITAGCRTALIPMPESAPFALPWESAL